MRVIFLCGSRVGWFGPSTAGAGTPSHRVQIAACGTRTPMVCPPSVYAR